MSEYYFLTSLLPELSIGHVPGLGFMELKSLLQLNLKEEDLKQVEIFLRLIDVENMRKVWLGEPLDPRGNLNREELTAALQNQMWSDEEDFEIEIKDFLEKYHTPEERVRAFSFLLGSFLQEKSELPGYLGAFYDFERKMRIVLLGFRAKKMGKKLEFELQYEDIHDPIVAQVLAQRDAKSYEPPFEFKELKPIFETFADQPTELNKELTEYRFRELKEMENGEIFSMGRILGYLARLLLVERWLELDVNEGIKIVDKIEGYVNG